MTNEIKETMKDAFLNGEDFGIRIHRMDATGINGVVAIRDEKTGIISTGLVYAKGKRVTTVSEKHDEIVSYLTAMLVDEATEETKTSIKIEELTKVESHVIIKETLTEEVQMDAKVQDETRKIVESGELKGVTESGVAFEVKQSSGVRKIKYGEEFYTVIGNKRLRVLKSTEKEFNEVAGAKPEKKEKKERPARKSKEVLPAQIEVVCEECGEKFMRSKFSPNQTKCSKCKPRRGGEKKPDRITVKCETCGKEFETSKFTPNVKQCPECKPRRTTKGESKPVEPRKCEVTGEMFTPSKFNPNATVSPEGKKIQKLQAVRNERIEQAFIKARGEVKLAGVSDDDLKTAIENAFDHNDIHAVPSMVKAVKDHFKTSAPKKETKTSYEASDEEQEEALSK